VHGALLTVVHPDNTPHGYNLTFAFPMLMFIIIAGALFLRFRGPHNVPGHAAMSSSSVAAPEATAMTGESAGGATVEAAAGAAGDVGAGAAGEPAVSGQAPPADERTEEG
jgi:hypothetical protein